MKFCAKQKYFSSTLHALVKEKYTIMFLVLILVFEVFPLTVFLICDFIQRKITCSIVSHL